MTQTQGESSLGPTSAERPLVGRLAPSPTGALHLGHARSFLLAWWSIRSRGGRLVLRLEDLDGERARPEHVDACLRDLEWLGLDWDGSPRLQSDGLERLRATAHSLVERGLAYPCSCARGDLRRSVAAPHAEQGELRYPGTCRDRFSSRAEALALGKGSALRLRVAPGLVTVVDELCGTQQFDVAGSVGDFAIERRDGIPAYQLAVVVDDLADGVSEVLRGDDLLASAARQQLLYAALGAASPRWIHVPLVVDAAGQRLAKRSDGLSLATLRSAGVAPETIVSWVARSAGHPVTEPIQAGQLLSQFSLRRLPLTTVQGSSDVFSVEPPCP